MGRQFSCLIPLATSKGDGRIRCLSHHRFDRVAIPSISTLFQPSRRRTDSAKHPIKEPIIVAYPERHTMPDKNPGIDGAPNRLHTQSETTAITTPAKGLIK